MGKIDVEMLDNLFSVWLPCHDETLIKLIEQSLDEIATSSMCGSRKSAIAVAAHRSLPLYLPYEFVYRTTLPFFEEQEQGKTTGEDGEEKKMKNQGNKNQPKKKNKKGRIYYKKGLGECGLFPTGSEHCPISQDLHRKWSELIFEVQRNLSKYTTNDDVTMRRHDIVRAIRLRVAFLLKLNHEVLASNRLIDWSLIQSQNLILNENENNNDDDENNDMRTPSSPASLLYANRCRLLPRIKSFIMSQMLLASTPTSPQYLLCPLLSWELLRGFCLPSIVAPPSGLARKIKNSSLGLNDNDDNDEDNDEEVRQDVNEDNEKEMEFGANDLLVPFSKLYFTNYPNNFINDFNSSQQNNISSHENSSENKKSIKNKSKDIISKVVENNIIKDEATVSIVIKVVSTPNFIYSHSASSSSSLSSSLLNNKRINDEMKLNEKWSYIKTSVFGQFMTQISTLKNCELRNQSARMNMKGEEKHEREGCDSLKNDDISYSPSSKYGVKDRSSGGSGGAVDRNINEKMQSENNIKQKKQQNWFVELQPQSLKVELEELSSTSTSLFPSSVIWRSLLYAICRDVQIGNVDLFISNSKLSNENENNQINNSSRSIFRINQKFLRPYLSTSSSSSFDSLINDPHAQGMNDETLQRENCLNHKQRNKEDDDDEDEEEIIYERIRCSENINISKEAIQFSSRIRNGSMENERETARIGWYVGFGQVMGMAIRTGVKLPIQFESNLWQYMVSAIRTMSSSSNGDNQSLFKDYEEVCGIVDGLSSIVPRDSLLLLTPLELEQLVCLPFSISSVIMKDIWGTR
mmetsp:Transcript_33463/g.39310  ORF Transcript_33463/g.39310 Transcript_33463/m.39310 type:complete len:804 (+) Transcript_33463:1364-3775(+)